MAASLFLLICYESPMVFIRSLPSLWFSFHTGGDARCHAVHLLCTTQEDSVRRCRYLFLSTLIISFYPPCLFLSFALSLALSLIWLAQANIIIRSSEEKPALIFQPLERGPSITGWWEDHRQSITLYEVVHVPTHEEAPRHASRWHLPAPSSGLPGLWRPSFLKGPNLISLFKWCSLNWISQAWVTTAKVPNFLLCWVTNGAVQPTGGDTAVAIMTPWLVWALGPQPTWTESLYQDQPPQFRQWARQTLPALCFYSSREVQSLWITSPFLWWLWSN